MKHQRRAPEDILEEINKHPKVRLSFLKSIFTYSEQVIDYAIDKLVKAGKIEKTNDAQTYYKVKI